MVESFIFILYFIINYNLVILLQTMQMLILRILFHCLLLKLNFNDLLYLSSISLIQYFYLTFKIIYLASDFRKVENNLLLENQIFYNKTVSIQLKQ